jgi:N-acetylglucosamine-6-phosphate deacetylase
MENGWVELQINGAYGIDLNGNAVGTDEVTFLAEKLRSVGVGRFLPTLITADTEVLRTRLARLAAAWAGASPEVREMIPGFHLEGPFLSEKAGYRGAHPEAFLRAADLDVMERLWEASAGMLKLVTLAPERDPGFRLTRWLKERGVVVSAGHCDPTLEQLRGAIDNGLTMFTHLGNGCPLEMHRHDNIINRVLHFADRLWIGLIPDGIHVPFYVMKHYLRLAGWERCFVVSDAIAAAGLGAGSFAIGDVAVEVDPDGTAWAKGRAYFAGSTVTWDRMAVHLENQMGCDETVRQALMRDNACKAMSGILSKKQVA